MFLVNADRLVGGSAKRSGTLKGDSCQTMVRRRFQLYKGMVSWKYICIRSIIEPRFDYCLECKGCLQPSALLCRVVVVIVEPHRQVDQAHAPRPSSGK